MIVTVYRSKPPGGPWLLDFDDGSPHKRWTAPPEVELYLDAQLAGDTVGRFQAEWVEQGGRRGLQVDQRIADA